MTSTDEQDFALGEEIRTAIELIRTGIRELQRVDAENDFYHSLILSLASGFERLMKTIICLQNYRLNGSYSGKHNLFSGKQGHDLVELLKEITTDCFDQSHLTVPAAKEDLAYLQKDIRLSRLVKILSEFGQAARYHNLDIVRGRTPTTRSTREMWEELEMTILTDHDDWADKLHANPGLDKVHKRINIDIQSRLERFARALARLFTIGGLGDKAKQHTGTIKPFLCLRDDELGKRKY